jgi:Family of unknown function (DUF5343)
VATTYPYTSAQGALNKTFEQFRKNFPASVDSDVLKKFGIAPGNESYIISILRFLGQIDTEGKKVDSGTDFFYADATAFQAGLEKQLMSTYKPLFDDHGDGAWELKRSELTTWFRITDKSSELIGDRQASTFITLAAQAGHGEVKAAPASKATTAGKKAAAPAKKTAETTNHNTQTSSAAEKKAAELAAAAAGSQTKNQDFGLSVRIEVNLPANGTPDVYDAIFSSVRKHLIDRD